MANIPENNVNFYSNFGNYMSNALRERYNYQVALGEIIYLVKTNKIEQLKMNIYRYEKLIKDMMNMNRKRK